jgi:hypothetical protein
MKKCWQANSLESGSLYLKQEKEEKIFNNFSFWVSCLKSRKSGDQQQYLDNEKQPMAELEGFSVISLCYVCQYLAFFQ